MHPEWYCGSSREIGREAKIFKKKNIAIVSLHDLLHNQGRSSKPAPFIATHLGLGGYRGWGRFDAASPGSSPGETVELR